MKKHKKVLSLLALGLAGIASTFGLITFTNKNNESNNVSTQESIGQYSYHYEDVTATIYATASDASTEYVGVTDNDSGTRDISVTVVLEIVDSPNSNIDISTYNPEDFVIVIDNRPSAATPETSVQYLPMQYVEGDHGLSNIPVSDTDTFVYNGVLNDWGVTGESPFYVMTANPTGADVRMNMYHDETATAWTYTDGAVGSSCNNTLIAATASCSTTDYDNTDYTTYNEYFAPVAWTYRSSFSNVRGNEFNFARGDYAFDPLVNTTSTTEATVTYQFIGLFGDSVDFRIYEDTNNNGIEDSGEAEVVNWTETLDVEATTPNFVQQEYTFTLSDYTIDLEADKYYVLEIRANKDNNKIFTTSFNTYTSDITMGSVNEVTYNKAVVTYDFTHGIEDNVEYRVIRDDNTNGVVDTEESATISSSDEKDWTVHNDSAYTQSQTSVVFDTAAEGLTLNAKSQYIIEFRVEGTTHNDADTFVINTSQSTTALRSVEWVQYESSIKMEYDVISNGAPGVAQYRIVDSSNTVVVDWTTMSTGDVTNEIYTISFEALSPNTRYTVQFRVDDQVQTATFAFTTLDKMDSTIMNIEAQQIDSTSAEVSFTTGEVVPTEDVYYSFNGTTWEASNTIGSGYTPYTTYTFTATQIESTFASTPTSIYLKVGSNGTLIAEDTTTITPVPPVDVPDNGTSPETASKIGLIVGLSIGIPLLLGIIAGVIYYLKKTKKPSAKPSEK